jgi:hypothetical protein
MSDTPKRGAWSRFVGWLRGSPETPLLEGDSLPDPEPVHLGPEEEKWLQALITDVGEDERVWQIGDEEFWKRIDGLWGRGHERLATEWVAKFIAAPATPEDKAIALRSRLVDLLDERGDLLEAVPHLEVLAELDEFALRANFLLAEHFRRRGDEARALRHYEAVLARDFDYPNVRTRVERLRAARGRDAPAAQGETMAGPDALGAAAGARYRLVRELGRGATGVVYLARDFELERDVAVKLLHPHLAAATRAEALAMFFSEARVAASLRHPNIVAILDMDETSRRIVMELGAGGTLRAVLEQRGPRTVRRALERHSQVLSALAAAHRRGIVHRDLKPGNLMFRRDPDAPGAEIMLGDFGVAHLPDVEGETGAKAAESGKPARAVGTLAYMSPEQRTGADADPRSDLYAAGVVLFEMLTGRAPWTRDILLAGTRSDADFTLPDELAPDADPQLLHGVQKHLDGLAMVDPEARPATAEALAVAQQLRDFAIATTSALVS